MRFFHHGKTVEEVLFVPLEPASNDRFLRLTNDRRAVFAAFWPDSRRWSAGLASRAAHRQFLTRYCQNSGSGPEACSPAVKFTFRWIRFTLWVGGMCFLPH